MVAARYHGHALADGRVTLELDSLAADVLARINESHAIWQQTGYMCDVWRWDDSSESAELYRGVPVEFVREGRLGRGRLLVVTLEYNQEIFDQASNVLATTRVHKRDHRRAEHSASIHPILRLYEDGELQETLHLLEDFENEWREPEHVEPLRAFIAGCLTGARTGRSSVPPPRVVQVVSPARETRRVDRSASASR